jgi:hypothetical protein
VTHIHRRPIRFKIGFCSDSKATVSVSEWKSRYAPVCPISSNSIQRYTDNRFFDFLLVTPQTFPSEWKNVAASLSGPAEVGTGYVTL